MAEIENGDFTNRGYLTQTRKISEVYRGPEDLPPEYRPILPPAALTQEPDTRSIKMCDTDLAALLLEMHAVGGDYMRDAQNNLETLANANNGDVFLVKLHAGKLIISPAELAFRKGTDEHEIWTTARKVSDDLTYVMSVTDRSDGRITGNISETGFSALRGYVREFCIPFTHLDFETKDGKTRRITLKEWNAMEPTDRYLLKNKVRHYDSRILSRLAECLNVLRWASEENRRPVTADEFLTQINIPFMSRADNPQPDMLRVAPEAAKDILAQNTAVVYRLMPGAHGKRMKGKRG